MLQNHASLLRLPGYGGLGGPIVRMSRILLVALSVMVVLAGCESKSRSSSRRLLEQVRLAQGKYTQALGLMSNAVFQSGSTFAPVTEKLSNVPTQLTPVTDQPHPKVVALLSEAQADLDRALSDNSAAAGEDLALAYSLAGQIQMLRAQYQTRLADLANQDVLTAMMQASDAVSLLSLVADQAAFTAQLRSMDPDKLTAMAQEASDEGAKLQQQAQQLQDQAQQFRQQREAIYQTNAGLSPQVRQLRIDSQLAAGQKALELSQQALAIEAQVGTNELDAAGLEFREDAITADLATLTKQVQAAQSRQKLAQDALANIEQFRARREQALAQQQEQLAACQQQVSTQMVQLKGSLAKLGASQQQATIALESAAKSFKRAQTEKGSPDPLMLSQEASARMTLAELQARQMRLGEQIASLTDNAATARSAAASAAPTASAIEAVAMEYPATPANELDQQAQQNYQSAAQLLQKATSAAAGPQKWTYQAQQAAAYLGIYRLSGSPDAVDNARRLLGEALQGKEAAPYLAPVHGLNRMATAMAENAPPVQPAPASDEAAPAATDEEAPAVPAATEEEAPSDEAAPAATPATPAAPADEAASDDTTAAPVAPAAPADEAPSDDGTAPAAPAEPADVE